VSGCDGDRLVSCAEDDAHESTVVDCAAVSATCREARSGAGLVLRGCWSGQNCPPGAPEARCDGPGAVISCHDGTVERTVCRPGTMCEEHHGEAGVVAACALPGRRRCDLRGSRYCEDGRLIECDRTGPGPNVKVTDCAGLGLRCSGAGLRAGCYVPSNVECDRELLPKCEGSSVVFCAAGRIAKVPCSAIGLGSCDPSAKGSIAACAPAKTAPSTPATPSK
jgi:hypothetical protein